MTTDDDLAKMGDPEFLAERARVREQLEHVPEASAELAARYQLLNDEFDRRASAAWRRQAVNTPGMITLHAKAARLLAVEVLLAEPEALNDDALESSLYILRDRLQGKDAEEE